MTVPELSNQLDMSSIPPPSLQNTFGAFLICTCLACMLSGFIFHQVYRYFRLYVNDLTSIKVLVLTLLTLDIVHTITNIHVCYYYLVTNYFQPRSLAEGVWSVRIGVLESGLVILVSHCFYARRLYLLGGHTFVPVVIIGLLLMVEIGFSIAATIETFIQRDFSRFTHLMYLIWGVLLAAVLVDVVATSILTVYLRRSRTGFKRTDSMVDIMMVYGINTGLSTSILTFTAFVCSVASKNTLIWAAITVVGTKMYTNSLLAVLNSRQSIIDKGMEGYDTGTFGLKVVTPRSPVARPIDFAQPSDRQAQAQSVVQRMIDIKITTETFTDGLDEGVRNSGDGGQDGQKKGR